MTTKELKGIYFGAYFFEELEDDWLQAFQYTKEQMDYFKKASDFWYDRCMASTAKTLEFTTEAGCISLNTSFSGRALKIPLNLQSIIKLQISIM